MENSKGNGKHKVVVIGAGLGGLCCAAMLAKKGVAVTILEQKKKAGGYATSFKRGGFLFEVSLHATPLGATPMDRTLTELGVRDEVEFVRLPELYRIVTPDHDVTFPPADPEGYIARLAEMFPSEREGIATFVRSLVGASEEILRLTAEDPLQPLLVPFRYRDMWKTRGKTLSRLMDEHISSADCQALMSPLWYYYGLPPSKLSAFYYSVATGQYVAQGGFYPRARSQEISDSLVGVVEDNGGEVLKGARVWGIRASGDRAIAVEDSRGRRHSADIVVSNASPKATFDRLLEQGKLHRRTRRKLARYRKKLDSYVPSLSSFIVWLGLEGDVTEHFEEAEIFLATGHDPDADYRAALACDPEEALLTVTAYDNIYPGYSPPGRSILSIMFLCSYDPWKRYANSYFRGDKKAYKAEKQRVAETLIRRVEERLIPGLSKRIVLNEVGTPLTNVRYTGNCEGAIYGYEQALNNTFINRIDNRTPIRNLFLASAWSNPGGGFAGALSSGKNTFKCISKDLGL